MTRRLLTVVPGALALLAAGAAPAAADDPSFGSNDTPGFGSFGAIFGVMVVLILVIGIGRPLGNEGLDATYIASSLRPQPTTSASPAPPEKAATRSAADRLLELQRLKDQGLVTAEEYGAQRKAIVDSV